MKFNLNNYLLVLFSIAHVNLSGQDEAFKRELINNMIYAIENHHQLEFEMQRNERNEKGFTDGKFYAKLKTSPFMVYLKNERPRKGSEILYVDGENNNKALINPNFFPYINISLNPESSLMLAGGHHSIKEIGFHFINNSFKYYKNTYGDVLYKITDYEGLYEWNNRSCHKIIVNYPNYEKLKYRAQEGETLYKIARKKLINVGKLREYNPGIDSNEELKKDQIIVINSLYAKKAIIFIDSENYFPIYQMIYDEEGLYEKYSFSDLKINCVFKDEEFTKAYEDYDF